jgi:hypothetical protein
MVQNYSNYSTIRCRLQETGSTEQYVNGRRTTVYTGRGYCGPEEDIRENDVFTYGGEEYEVLSVIEPDFMGVFKQFDFRRGTL